MTKIIKINEAVKYPHHHQSYYTRTFEDGLLLERSGTERHSVSQGLARDLNC